MKLSEKIQEALREQQEINLSDPAVQKRLAAQWGYVPAGEQVAPVVKDERAAFREWFEGEQGVAYDGLWSFAKAAWLARAALGAPSVPGEKDASVRRAWARFSHELHRSPDAPYPGMADAFEQHFSQSFIDREWRAEAATWAAAWKAAKSHCAQPAPSIPEGWKLVPIEPTTEMICEMEW